MNDGGKAGLRPTNFPRVTLITPNYNGAAHLEETIRSVISQDYPNLQYIVIDGGSTDGSVDIIKRYEAHIDYWVSESDAGPAEAINKGLAKADGEWINWLNSDDFLLPRALHALARVLARFPDAAWVVGNRLDVDSSGAPIRFGMSWENSVDIIALGGLAFPQDATFISAGILRAAGGKLNDRCKSMFDTELFARMIQLERPLLTTVPLTCFRRRQGQISNDKALQASEYHVLDSYYATLPLMMRLARRLTRTRLQFWVFACVAALVRSGMIRGPHNWPVAVPEPESTDVRVDVAASYLQRLTGGA